MSEQFIVSARKYRPQRFDDVVGQEHISGTLKNSLKSNHLAHSFLFCGPRGVGKTTTARILAKTINCKNITAEYEACDQCDSCLAFNQNSSFNIHELDAASNNSVDDIRALNEQVRYAPQNGKYKIYIIDEVHMLSLAAFNAFLKTLEEPPPYAIFILATTEKHKIIPTILSRCQIFDFKRITIEAMSAHLKKICTQENIQADETALQLIAQKADGGLRDALSMFDRLCSLKGDKLEYKDALENLNMLDYDYFFRMTDAIATENSALCLNLIDEIITKGFEPENLIQGLAEHMRNLLICKDPSTIKLLHHTGNIEQRYLNQAQQSSENLIINALNLASECDVQYKTAKNKRLLVEVTLIKMCYINKLSKTSLLGNQSSEQKKNDLTPEMTPPAPAIKEVTTRDKEDVRPTIATAAKPLGSLQELQKKLQQEKTDPKDPIDPQIDIFVEEPMEETREILTTEQAWKEVLREYQGKTGTIELLEQMVPKIEEKSITLGVVNNIHLKIIEKEIASISRIIEQRTGLSGFLLKIEEVKEDQQNSLKRRYTKQEQIQMMIKANPKIAEMQKKFGLDFDY